jgi:hypothetical protein
MKQEIVIIIENNNGEIDTVIRQKGQGNFEVIKAQRHLSLENLAEVLNSLQKDEEIRIINSVDHFEKIIIPDYENN